MWDAHALEKARCYELACALESRLAAAGYGWLIGMALPQIRGRLVPVRYSTDYRWVRFYGRDCVFVTDESAAVAGYLLRQFFNGTPWVHQARIVAECDLKAGRQISDVLKHCEAYKGGLIHHKEGIYGWQIPEDELHKPTLLVLPAPAA